MLGGLSTYTKQWIDVFSEMGIEYDVFHWKSPQAFKNFDSLSYTQVFHVHPWGSFYWWLFRKKKIPYINAYHGTEILFYSPSKIKSLLKLLVKPLVLNVFEGASKNIFISSFTQSKLEALGFKIRYDRDFVLHNSTSLKDSILIKKSIQNVIELCCIARDVPHKNLKGAVVVAESLQTLLPNHKIRLTLTSSQYRSSKVEIIPIKGISEEQKEEIYKRSHFNILCSKDHSTQGFFEGFGLTPLEAAKYGTPSIGLNEAGLMENIHSGINGFLLSDLDIPSLETVKECILNAHKYELMRSSTFEHVRNSHGEDQMRRFWEVVCAA